jgi:SAM-dependent methyltransferase
MCSKYENNYYPILIDNRKLREEIPQITEHFDRSRDETLSLCKNFVTFQGVIVDSKIINWRQFCPICNSHRTKQFLVKYGFIYEMCTLCSHIYVKNCLDEGKLLEYYRYAESDKIYRSVNQNRLIEKYNLMLYDKYLEIISKYKINNKNLIDIGSGDGNFLSYCQEKTDYNLHALEFGEDAISHLIEIVGKENLWTQKIEEIDFHHKKFGIITLWGVIEHLIDPISTLSKCAEILDQDGVMILLFPNNNSRALKILGVNTPTLNPRHHLHVFSLHSFEEACNRSGLELIDTFGELPIIDLMYPYVYCDNDLIDEIIANNESYYYACIVKKVKSKTYII